MSLEKKIVALVIFFGIAVGCVFIYINQRVFSQWVSNEREKHARYVASEVTTTAGQYILTGNVFGLQSYIDRLMLLEQEAGRTDLAYLFIQDGDGSILAHTFGDSFPSALKGANKVRSGDKESAIWLATEDGVIFDLAVPLQKKGLLGTVRIGLSYTSIAKNIRDITVFIFFVVLSIILLASSVFVFLIRRWLDPIPLLAQAFERVKEGDFSQRVNIRGHGELGRLAQAFNRTVARLQETTVSKFELEKTVVLLETEVDARKKAEDILRQNYNVQSSLNSFLRLSLEDIDFEGIFDAALGILFGIPLFSLEPKGAIFLAEGQHLVMKAQKNLSAYLLKECARMPFGKCLCGKAALTKKVQFVNALEDSHEVRYDGIKPHGHYCVPILFGEELLGVLNMYIPAQQPYDQKAEEFLKAVTNVFANMIVRKRAEAALRKSEANLSLAQRLARMGSWEWRSDKDEFFWSKEACSLFERETGQMPKTVEDLLNFIHTEDREKFRSFYQKIMAEQKDRFSSEFRILASSGKEHFVRVEGSLTKRKEPEGALELAGTIRDMTFQKEIEKSQRLVQLGVLVARVAHEVNNPLMVVSGHAQLALMEEIKDSGLKRDLEVIVKECDRAKYIIQRLLTFSKPSKGEDEEVDINEAIDEIVLLLEHQYSLENVSIKRSYGPGLPRLKTDRKGFQEVISNLLNNAQDAIEDKGSIEIATMFREGFIKIDISDTGKGMSEEVVNKIFDPFFSTKPMGTGLGLSVSYSIIKGFGGDLTFQSAPGEGTTATVTLPVEKQ